MFLMEHFQEGGWGMYPIAALLVITVWITAVWTQLARIDVTMHVTRSM